MHIIRKTDMALIAFFIFCAIMLVFIFILIHPSGGGQIVVSIDGVDYLLVDLELNEGRRLEIHSERGFNEIMIENRSVRMISADCPDQLCLHQLPVSRGFQSIVCLPNRVVVELRNVAESEDWPDGIVR